MKYGVNYQYLPRGASRPLDYGNTVDIPDDDDDQLPLPNVGDFVSIEYVDTKGEAFSGRVKSRLFRYTVGPEERRKWCQVNIVVEETSDDWGLLIKE